MMERSMSLKISGGRLSQHRKRAISIMGFHSMVIRRIVGRVMLMLRL